MTPQSPPVAAPARPHVLIIGCGFGGLEAARGLARAPVDITVVDRSNHHLFQPLLYQVATGGLSAPSIAAPARSLFRRQRNVTTLLGEVQALDVPARCAVLGDGSRLHWDHLIVAAGATHSYFGRNDWAQHAPGLKTLEDAFELRRRILLAFERAEQSANGETLNFVVIGAGPTGVEMAGTMAEVARYTLRDEFRRIDPAQARVLLIEGGPRVLPSMPEDLSARALTQLQALGVEVRLNARVTDIAAHSLQLSTPAGTETLSSVCTVWAAGVAASPLGAVLAQATGCELDRSGRVRVLPDLSLPAHPHIQVIGDLAAAQSQTGAAEPKAVPGVSPAAKQMGRCAARNVLHRLAQQPTEAFRYRDHGNLATIGRHSAVVDLSTPLGPLRFSGLLAWWFWLFAHVYFLIGFRNRLVVLTDWAWAYWTHERHARVVSRLEERIRAP